MAIIAEIKNILPYIQTVAGKVLCRFSSQAIGMDDGKNLQEAYDELNGNKINKYNLTTDEVATGELFLGSAVYSKLINVGSLPNKTSKTVSTNVTNANYIWIDPTYSMAFNAGASYPIPYSDPNSFANSITASLASSGQSLTVVTGSNWSAYVGYITVKYTKK